MGKDVVMKKDLELKDTDIKDKDLLISLGMLSIYTPYHFLYRYGKETSRNDLTMNIGGDGTYLRTSGVIENSDLPILGLNTDPSRSTGFLCNHKIFNNKKE
jgi:NAD kinase